MTKIPVDATQMLVATDAAGKFYPLQVDEDGNLKVGGEITVSVTGAVSTIEHKQVTAATAAATAGNPAAKSTYMQVVNYGTVDVIMKVGNGGAVTASATDGIPVFAKGSQEISGVEITHVSFYNASGTTTADIRILFAR